ncbi:MAG: LptF/LptG family permease [Spirochaetaceae bacterium]|nr:LptF/LptG family permease [Spirochaetaceae bacterium]
MIIDKYILKQFTPVFFISVFMFILLLILIDLFLNLVHYLNYNAPFQEIIRATFLYIPKSFSYALPMSLIFAIAYTLGDLYAKNELTSIISSGVPFWRIGSPLIIIGAAASVFSFFFEDAVVVPTLKQKNELTRTLRHQPVDEKNSNIVIKSEGGNRIYSVDYYDITNTQLNGVSIIEREEDGKFASHTRAFSAHWDGAGWILNGGVIYEWDGDFLTSKPFTTPSPSPYTESPETFRRGALDPKDLRVRDVRVLIRDLKQSELPYLKVLADYHHRFSFSAVSFIVVVLSISMGGRFRKNIMLMSLLASLAISVIYYVMEMISMMMADFGILPPIMGAWLPVFLFTGAGFFLVRYSKT